MTHCGWPLFCKHLTVWRSSNRRSLDWSYWSTRVQKALEDTAPLWATTQRHYPTASSSYSLASHQWSASIGWWLCAYQDVELIICHRLGANMQEACLPCRLCLHSASHSHWHAQYRVQVESVCCCHPLCKSWWQVCFFLQIWCQTSPSSYCGSGWCERCMQDFETHLFVFLIFYLVLNSWIHIPEWDLQNSLEARVTLSLPF